jgi:hypothetical protein
VRLRVNGLLHEVEGDGADQDARTEPHDPADHAQAQPEAKRDHCPDDE